MPVVWSLLVAIQILHVSIAVALPGPESRDAQNATRVAAAAVPEGFFPLPVTGGLSVLDRLGVRPEERATALVLIARALYGAGSSPTSAALAVTFTEIFGPITDPVIRSAPAADSPPAVILAPFSERTWRRVLAIDDRADLFTTLTKHRGALLTAAAAIETGPGVREWLDREPALLQQIVLRWAGAFAQAAPGLALANSRLTVPGGQPHDAAWTALAGAAPSRPAEFLRQLMTRDEGRLGRFFATLAGLDDQRRAALVAPLPGQTAEGALASLYALARDADAPLDPNLHPFQLSYADLPSVLHALNDLPVDRLPAGAAVWPAVLTGDIESRAEARQLVSRAPTSPAFGALVRAMLAGGPRERRDHIATIALARRLWQGAPSPDAQADAAYALSHYRRFRALWLTLDRIDVSPPTVWAAMVDAARRADEGGGGDRELRLTLFQGALALVCHSRLSGSLDSRATARVLEALAHAVQAEPGVDAAVRSWMLTSLMPALPPLVRPDRFSGKTAYESRVLQALAGPPPDRPRPFAWEGFDYAVDVAAAEHRRILRIREQLPSPGLDAALGGDDAAALSAAMRALAYAPALGDPDGAITLSPDVVDRHDLVGRRASPGRDFAWLPAQERTGAGAPWHVANSLLGLDLALVRSAMRRLSADEMPPVPTINLNDQLTLARTTLAMRSVDLDDATRDELAAAIVRGRDRLAAAGADATSLIALGDEVGMAAGVRHTLGWTLASVPDAAASLLSLRDLLWLGRPRVEPATLARWGVFSGPVDGRLSTRFDAPVAWDRLAGRPDTGIMATQVPDLTLRLVEVTAARRIPAALIPALLLYATQDYWHDVEARYADDGPAMARGAAKLLAGRVEDYVAALASDGPLRPR